MCQQGPGPVLQESHRSSPLAAEQPCDPFPALPPSPCWHDAGCGHTETSNPHLSPPSYGLSCEIEPLSESASNTLKAKKNTGIIKRWSE